MSSILQAQIVAMLCCWDTRKEIKRGQNVAVQQPKPTPSFAGQFLKDYRKAHNLSQEQLAYDLSMEPRTLRSYENGERQLNNINELRRIADVLGIEPERLGLASSLSIPRTPEHIEEVITHVWSLVEESRLQEALTIVRRLTHNLQTRITTEDPKLLRSVARAHHAAGYVISEATRASESYDAIFQYEQMEALVGQLAFNLQKERRYERLRRNSE